MRILRLKTGNLNKQRSLFEISVGGDRRDSSRVELGFEPWVYVWMNGTQFSETDNAIKHCINTPKSFWSGLFKKNKDTLELLKNEPRLSLLQPVLSHIETTPQYQLFLAGFDLSNFIGLTHQTDKKLMAKMLVTDGSFRSFLGTRNLTFIPDTVPFDEVSEELIAANKLAEVTLILDSETIKRLYIPYNTPWDTSNLSDGAKTRWREIGNSFFR